MILICKPRLTQKNDKVNRIMFWTMGSLEGSSYTNALILIVSLVLFGGLLLRYARELNAFAIGEDNARHIGVNVKRVKLVVMITVSALIGVSVSIGGTIGFVGLVMPHMTRMIVGPNHRRMLPSVMFAGDAGRSRRTHPAEAAGASYRRCNIIYRGDSVRLHILYPKKGQIRNARCK